MAQGTFCRTPCSVIVAKNTKRPEDLRAEAQRYRNLANHVLDDQALAAIDKLIEELEQRAQELEERGTD